MKGNLIIYLCYGVFILMAAGVGYLMFFDEDTTPVEKAAVEHVSEKPSTDISHAAYVATEDNAFTAAKPEKAERPTIMGFIENLYPNASYSIMDEYGAPMEAKLRPHDFVGRNGMPKSYIIVYKNPLTEGGALPMPDGTESGAPITHVYCATLERVEPLPNGAKPEYVPSPDLYSLRMDEMPSNDLRCGWAGKHVVYSRFRN